MTDRPVALITAASKGIGAACARELSRRGYQLVLMSRSEAITAIAGELGAVPVTGSVSDEAALSTLVSTAVDRFGRIDVVVNNTGHAPKGELTELTDSEWLAGFDLLLLNVIRITRLVLPSMLSRGQGSFVNLSTFGAREPSLKFPVSSTIRAALGAYTKLFSERYAAAGIRMNCVLPGLIDTYPADDAARAAIPAGRLGAAEEVARVVGFLASDESSYLTGQSVLVDGGLVRGL